MSEIVIPEMACQELVELVTNYLEGALSEEDRTRFEAHIAGCDACTNYLEQMRQTIRALGHLPPESISPDAQRELLAVFNAWKADR
jgi:anti-sigma factor RsiW